MPLHETEAIVLRSYRLGEADKIVSLFTREFGRLRGVAGGARRRMSRFGASLEPLTYLRVWFYERENRDLVRLNSTEVVESFMDIQREYSGQVAAQYVAEVCDQFMPERESNDRVFRLIVHVLRGLKQPDHLDAILCYFSAWMLRLGGVLSDLDQCSRCGRTLGVGAAYYGNSWEGLCCTSCREGQGRQLHAASRELCRSTQWQTLERWRRSSPEMETSRSLRQFLDEQIERHIERKLVTKQLLDEAQCL